MTVASCLAQILLTSRIVFCLKVRFKVMNLSLSSELTTDHENLVCSAVETLVLYCSSFCWMERKQLQTARDSGLAKKTRDQQREERRG